MPARQRARNAGRQPPRYGRGIPSCGSGSCDLERAAGRAARQLRRPAIERAGELRSRHRLEQVDAAGMRLRATCNCLDRGLGACSLGDASDAVGLHRHRLDDLARKRSRRCDPAAPTSRARRRATPPPRKAQPAGRRACRPTPPAAFTIRRAKSRPWLRRLAHLVSGPHRSCSRRRARCGAAACRSPCRSWRAAARCGHR